MRQKSDYPRVPYGMSVHGEEEISAVIEVLRTSTLMGKHVRAMEAEIAELFEKRTGVMVNSGSSALYLAVEILDLPHGSEVITPALTFATTVACLVKNRLVPSFIDVEEAGYCSDVGKIEEMITENTRAVCIPNLLGNIADWRAIRTIADKFSLKIIEDSCDTLGGSLNGRSSGAWSDISVTSFYGSHVINCAGNGGMLCLNNEEMARRAKLLRSWGRSSSLFVDSEDIGSRFSVQLDGIDYDAKFVFEEIGYNWEPSEIGAAFGLVQLRKLQSNIDMRHKIFMAQYDFFSRYAEWFVLPKQRADSRTGWLAFPLCVRPTAPFTRRDMQIFLEGRNIQTRAIMTGNILRQPGFRNIQRNEHANGYPVADSITRGGVLLACHQGLNPALLSHVHESFEEFAAIYR